MDRSSDEPLDQSLARKHRQVIYWRMLAAIFGQSEVGRPFEQLATQLVDQLELPSELLDGRLGMDQLLHRYPRLRPVFESLNLQDGLPRDEQLEGTAGELPGELPGVPKGDASSLPTEHAVDLPKSFACAKLLLNVFGPNTQGASCSAAQYSQWCDDVAELERCFGFGPGQLRPGGGTPGDTGQHASGGRAGAGLSGTAPRIDDRQLREELVAMESDLIKRMELREVLKDDRLAARLTPTLPLIEQLLYDKSNLSGPALKNARRLVRKYVDELAAVLRQQVATATAGPIDRSVPPKRVFRNLDLKRTVWKNLPNYDPREGTLYVDRLFYRHTVQKSLNRYLIVVVDQSGSMVDAMVQCAILASIFATLPRVQVSLLAFDTNVIDLTPWVDDPLESLMRTNLGGGNDGPRAMEQARAMIVDPRRTTMVWISDFYEFENDRPLFNMIKSVKESGVHFIPVGSVSGRGYFSVNEWFRKQLKAIGLPVLTGNIKKLIVELKKQLN